MQQGKILSIRLSPDGLSFWTTDVIPWTTEEAKFKRDFWSATSEKELKFDPAKTIADNLSECVQVIRSRVVGGWSIAEVYPDTLRMINVPTEYASVEAVPGLLEINNITHGEADDVLCADISPSIKAVMVYDREPLGILRDMLGEITIASPFSINNAHIERYGIGRRRVAAVYLTPARAYVTVFEKKSGEWLFADVMKWSTSADILYYMSVLDQELGLRKCKVYMRGARAGEVCSLLRKYFRKTRCE